MEFPIARVVVQVIRIVTHFAPIDARPPPMSMRIAHRPIID
jgi:hypothetical protein